MNSLVGDPLINPNRFNPDWMQFLSLSQFSKPADFYVFTEEHPDTINDGYFMNRWDTIKWGNLPASHHNRGANLSWADGHMERHRWVVPDTICEPVPGGAHGGFVPSDPFDYLWLRERTSFKLTMIEP